MTTMTLTMDDNKIITPHTQGIHKFNDLMLFARRRTKRNFYRLQVIYKRAPKALPPHHRLLCRRFRNSNEYCLLLRLALAQFGFYLAIFVTVCGMSARKYVSNRYPTTMDSVYYLAIRFCAVCAGRRSAHEPNDWQLISAPDIFRLIKNERTSNRAIFLRWQTWKLGNGRAAALAESHL